MNRGAGTGLLGLGVVMAVIGAIMNYAITADAEGFSINTIGLIMLIAGIALAVVGIVLLAMGSSRRTTVHEDVHQTPHGTERIQDRRDSAL